MSSQLVAPNLLSQSPSEEPQFNIGDYTVIKSGDLRGAFEYVRNEGGAVAGDWLLIDQFGDATKLTTTNAGSVGQKVGIACCDQTDERCAWVWRGHGEFEALVTNAVAAGTALTTTATAGVAGTGGTALKGGVRTLDLGVTSTRVTIYCAEDLCVGS